jgi:hypothetical protein
VTSDNLQNGKFINVNLSLIGRLSFHLNLPNFIPRKQEDKGSRMERIKCKNQEEIFKQTILTSHNTH